MTKFKQMKLLGAGIALLLIIGGAEVWAKDDTQQITPLPTPLSKTDYLYESAPPEAMFELGRVLFFDPILSGNRNISCGTCHDPARGSSDGVAR